MFPELELREGWITVVCLILMVLCVAWSIQAADWADGLSILQGTVLVGGLMGIVLAKSRVPNRLAHLLSLLAGWTWAVYLSSQVLARAFDMPGPMAVAELEARFYGLFLIFFNEGATADNHVFLLLLGFLLWIMAYFCAWAVFRWQRVWWAVIVCGVAILLNMNYAAANLTIYLILFLLFALLLVVRASLAFYEQQWREAHIGYSPELISVFLRAGLFFSIVVILLAWVAPAALASRPLQPFWDKIGEPWRNFQERSAKVFQDLNYQNEPPLVSLGDRRMWFGGPVNLSDTPVAEVDATTGRYWRVVVFHEYTSDGWLSNDPDIILIGENEQDLAFPELDLRFEMSQTVTLLRDWQTADALIAAAQPLRAGLPLRAAVTFVTHEEDLVRAPDASAFPAAPGDPSALYARRQLRAGESYEVLSSVTKADEESLRQAGISYPAWVTPRYLQLPESLPQRVEVLAEEITEGQETPYDKATAIETYLRRIPYDETIEGPRFGQDGVDYFVFDAKAGYCDYYASAMVVMLRSVGVPARYVRGYSQGETEEGVFLLRESDGHAWPEVFFPGYGWVEFEPTGGEPALIRPASLEGEDADSAGGSEMPGPRQDLRPLFDEEPGLDALGTELELGPQTFWEWMRPWGWFGLGIAVLGLAGLFVLAIRRRRQIEGLSMAERAYDDLVNWARRLLRIEPMAHQTPHEYAGIVAQQVPRGRKAVEQIAGLYVEERFGAKEVPGAHAEVAWQQVWPALWRRGLERRVEGVRRVWWLLIPPKQPPES
jgi:transglutaminase-like putative cysteine protease